MNEAGPPPLFDLSKPLAGHQYKASLDREEYPSERYVRLFKDVMVFVVAVVLVGIVTFLCCKALLQPGTQPDEQKWAMSVLSAMVGGLVGYLVKR